MTFGVNLIPKNSNNTQQTLGNSENKWDIYAEDLIVDNINGKTPITGVKGAANETYKTGEVNLTPADLGIPSANATQSTNGFMSSSDKIKLDGIEEGAEVNSITGVKGNTETDYRTGNINLTPENIGAKIKQTAVNDPTANGTAVEFIDSISQNIEGVITPTKKIVATVTTLADGLMSATDKTKLDGIEAGAEVNTITGIKGNEESTYRTGNINLTSADIGAKAIQTAVTDPVAEGTSIEFIDSIEQDAQGVITPTKKTVASATTSTAGLMSAADKIKLDEIEAGAEVNPDIANNLTETTTGKVLDATQGKVLKDTIDNLDAEDVGAIKDDYSYDAASYPYTGQELILLHNNTTGENTVTDVASFLSSAGGGSGTNQGALVHYTKTISVSAGSNAQTFPNSGTDDNITENMVVLQAVISNPAAQGSDWTFTTTNGTVTLNGTVNAATNVTLYFGVSLTAAPSIQVNLGSTSADNILKTNPTPGVMGTLGRGNGGTGVNATDAADLRSKLGITLANIGAAADSAAMQYRGWYPNGQSMLSLTPGYYQTSPNNMPSETFPSSINPYGILCVGDTEYTYITYISVLGDFMFWRSNGTPTWYVVQHKGYVPVSSGGTGATTPAAARTNLEITPANIGAVNKAGDTITGQLRISFNDYPSLRGTRTDSGEASIYLENNTSGWALGVNTWSQGANSFAIGNYMDDNVGWCLKIDGTTGLVSLSKALPVASGGTGATTPAGAISKLFDISANDARNYPNAPGVYRTVGTNIFSNLQPGSTYGVLIIIGRVYAAHFYIDSYSNMYVGYSGGVFGEPTTWRRCTP